jgi:methylated-DNA-protein-cysteine methyltransferase-like protein
MDATSGRKPPAVALTPFQTRCFELVRTIPAGKCATYGGVAAALGSCARAVGQSMRRNPLSPSTGCANPVPWQRVIATTRWLGGFSGSWGESAPSVLRKRDMLAKEGVAFDADGRVSIESIHTFAAAAAPPVRALTKPMAAAAAAAKQKKSAGGDDPGSRKRKRAKQ